MDTRAWIVAIIFGLASGLILGRYRNDRRVLMASMILTMVIGVVVWLVNPDHIAGPSLAAGGAALSLGGLFSNSRTRTVP